MYCTSSGCTFFDSEKWALILHDCTLSLYTESTLGKVESNFVVVILQYTVTVHECRGPKKDLRGSNIYVCAKLVDLLFIYHNFPDGCFGYHCKLPATCIFSCHLLVLLLWFVF